MAQPELLYYFTSTKYALESVQNRQLKVAELDKTNDPYELLPIRGKEGLTEATVDELFSNLQSNLAKKIKMICFSETYKDPALWGHYADKCKGVCLGFEIVFESFKDMLHEVEYVKDKKDYNQFVFGDSTEEGESTDFLRFKSHQWEHEEEWRILLTEDFLELDATTGLYFFPFARMSPRKNALKVPIEILKLRKILIGFRCHEENIKRRFEKLTERDPDPLEKLAGHNLDPPEIFFTRRSSSAFKIEVDEDRQE